MGGVDRLSQVRKTYGFDRKSKRYWIRPFFQFFDYAINNAYLLYKHNCKLFDMPSKELLDFRVGLVKLLVRRSRYRKRPMVPQSKFESFQRWHIKRKVSPLLGCRQMSSSSHHLCLLIL